MGVLYSPVLVPVQVVVLVLLVVLIATEMFCQSRMRIGDIEEEQPYIRPKYTERLRESYSLALEWCKYFVLVLVPGSDYSIMILCLFFGRKDAARSYRTDRRGKMS